MAPPQIQTEFVIYCQFLQQYLGPNCHPLPPELHKTVHGSSCSHSGPPSSVPRGGEESFHSQIRHAAIARALTQHLVGFPFLLRPKPSPPRGPACSGLRPPLHTTPHSDFGVTWSFSSSTDVPRAPEPGTRPSLDCTGPRHPSSFRATVSLTSLRGNVPICCVH